MDAAGNRPDIPVKMRLIAHLCALKQRLSRVNAVILFRHCETLSLGHVLRQLDARAASFTGFGMSFERVLDLAIGGKEFAGMNRSRFRLWHLEARGLPQLGRRFGRVRDALDDGSLASMREQDLLGDVVWDVEDLRGANQRNALLIHEPDESIGKFGV